MNIVVCVKHVPDVQSERRIEEGLLVRGEDDVLNELDENAIEAAVTLAEDCDDAQVIVVCAGDDDAEDAVRRALQMGADRGLLISDEQMRGADVPTTARVLAAAINRIGDVDLVLTGMASLDAMTSMMPAAMAATLQMPALTLAHEVSVDDGHVTITRTLGTLTESLRAPLPAVVSVTDQANEPRYPNFAAMRAAKSKPIDVLSLDDLGMNAEDLVSRVRVDEATPRPERQAGTIVTDAGEAGAQLAQWLTERGLV